MLLKIDHGWSTGKSFSSTVTNYMPMFLLILMVSAALVAGYCKALKWKGALLRNR